MQDIIAKDVEDWDRAETNSFMQNMPFSEYKKLYIDTAVNSISNEVLESFFVNDDDTGDKKSLKDLVSKMKPKKNHKEAAAPKRSMSF